MILSPTINIIRNRKRKFKHLNIKDGGHIIFKCKKCEAGLLDIWLTRPDEDKKLTLKAVCNCPFCGDMSYTEQFDGRHFHVGGFGVNKQEDENDSLQITHYQGVEIKNGIIRFTVSKAEKNTQPIKVD